MNQQREVIYTRRSHALKGENLREEIIQMMGDYIDSKINQYTGEDYSDNWDWDGLRFDIQKTLLLSLPVAPDEKIGINQSELFERIFAAAQEHYRQKEQQLGEKLMRQIERLAMLRVIDERWREHLYEMDHLKEGIGLRAYGQKNPLLEYKSEGFSMFTEMLDMINEQVIALIFKAQVQPEPMTQRRLAQMTAIHDSSVGMGFIGPPRETVAAGPGQPPVGKRQPVVVGEKIGRNDPCPCGSGKKYKKCHGAV
jgi:preprotein translocase subunit SecA